MTEEYTPRKAFKVIVDGELITGFNAPSDCSKVELRREARNIVRMVLGHAPKASEMVIE